MLRIGPCSELVSICFKPESGGKYVCTCYKPQTTASQCIMQLNSSQSILDAIVIENQVLIVLTISKDWKAFLTRFNLETGGLLLEPLMICDFQENTQPIGRVYYKRHSQTIDVGLFTPVKGPLNLFRVKDDSTLEVQSRKSLSALAHVGWLTSPQHGLVFAHSDSDTTNKNQSTMIRCSAIQEDETQNGPNGLDYWFSRTDDVYRMEFSEGGRAALALFNNGMIQIMTHPPSAHQVDSDKATVEMELYLPQNVSVDQITKLVLAWTCNGYRPIVLLKNGTVFGVSSPSSNKGLLQFAQDVLDVQCHDVFGVRSFTQFHVLHRDGSLRVFDEDLRLLCHLKSTTEDVLSLPDSIKSNDNESAGLKAAKEAIIKRIAMVEKEKAHKKRMKRDQLKVVESLERFAVGNLSRFEFPHESVPLVNENTGLAYVPSAQPNVNEDFESKPTSELLNCWYHGPSSLVVVECIITCEDTKDKPTAVHLSLSKGKAHRGNFRRLSAANGNHHFVAWAELAPSTSTTSTNLQLVILAEIVRGRNLAISSHVVHVLQIPMQCVLASQWVNVLKGEANELGCCAATPPPPHAYVVDQIATRLVSKCDWESIQTKNNVISTFASVQRDEENSTDSLERVTISALGDTRLTAMLQVLASNSNRMYKCYDEEIGLVERIKDAFEKEKELGDDRHFAQTSTTDELVSQLVVLLHKDACTNI